MSSKQGRYQGSGVRTADGWSISHITPPTQLFGANGLRTGPDGRIYVAQVSGSQISAIDVNSSAIEVISPLGGAIVGPDDLAFDDEGNLYATEITEGRVTSLSPNGQSRVINGDMPVANPITFHQGRLIAGELRMDGRILELDRNGGAAKVLLTDVPMANAFEFGPDGKLYFPVMGTNEIWRSALDGSPPEVVAGDLGVPDAVKFDSEGFIVSTQVATGQVLRIDPRTGEKTTLASLPSGLDNLTFVDNRLFVSSISGQITEILKDGATKPLIADGMNWPLGLALDETGNLFIADGAFNYILSPSGEKRTVSTLFTPGTPGYVRGVVSVGDGAFIVTTAVGHVSRFWPDRPESELIAEGFDELFGIVVTGQTILVAEAETGRVHAIEGGQSRPIATGLSRPKGLALGPDGTCYISESTGGRVVKIVGSATETVIDGLIEPQGLLVQGNLLYVLDVGAQKLITHDLETGARQTLASGLPIGVPAGVVRKPLGAIGHLSGPMGPFADIIAGPNGALYLSGDAEGSVLALKPTA